MTTLELSTHSSPPLWWNVLPDIQSRCVQRFFVNYRLPLDRARRILPSQLAPVEVDGVAVASACVLQLDRVVPGSVALPVGHRSRNCAHRIAVVHRETGERGVYVHRRNTDSPLASWLTSLGYPGHHRHVDLTIRREAADWVMRMALGRPLVQLRARPADADSSLFSGTAAFTDFVEGSGRSWAPSILPGRLVVIDLVKNVPSTYTPLAVDGLDDVLIGEWLGAPAASGFDSAFRTAGGAYVWHYIGIE